MDQGLLVGMAKFCFHISLERFRWGWCRDVWPSFASEIHGRPNWFQWLIFIDLCKMFRA
jgi:hypothetical protein